MLYSFCYLFLMFFVYSIIGYICEVTSCSLCEKKVVLNRGFFLGPYLPIYGVGGVLMTIFLGKYKNDLVTLFINSMVLCSLVEFFTSYILEKIYKVRWWDYSDRRFNIEGRICLSNAILFGIGGVALIYIINPFLLPLFDKIPKMVLIVISITTMLIFIVDFIISVVTLHNIKISSNIYMDHDATSEIKLMVKEDIEKHPLLITRLLNAFPKMSGKNLKVTIDIKKLANEIKKNLSIQKEKLKENKTKKCKK